MNNCTLCNKPTQNLEAFWPLTLIIPSLEEKILAFNNDWEKMAKELPEEEYKNLDFYQQLISTVGRAIWCNGCIEKDDYNFNLYYNEQTC